MANRINDLQLIKLVEGYPILYDKTYARKPTTSAWKDKVWKEISSALNASERACITRWKSLRDRYVREYRRTQTNHKAVTNWAIFHKLGFLRNNVKFTSDPLGSVVYMPKKRKARTSKTTMSDSYESPVEDEMIADEIMMTQQLIGLVKQYPVLYDKIKIRDSKNVLAKNEAWLEISDCLGLTGEECFNRWKKLRDRFAREYRTKIIFPDRPVLWTHYSDLTFLCEHFRKGVPISDDNVNYHRMKSFKILSDDEYSNNFYDEFSESEECVLEINEETAAKYENKVEESYLATDSTIDDSNKPHIISVVTTLPPTETESPCTNSNEIITSILPLTLVDNTASTVTTTEMNLNSLTTLKAELEMQAVLSTLNEIQVALESSKKCINMLTEKLEQEREKNTKHIIKPNFMQKLSVLLDMHTGGIQKAATTKILQFIKECKSQVENGEQIENLDPKNLLQYIYLK
ncbi:uncharacterized protein LOC119662463 [Teleopsis dalmanni]|uniref:uncharacterized protein LOC119662463 n=1 Tax=Teleopsis dalmanni TaxID=139649 RepID=UPI0018CE4ECF|nr:uncharacterized protein LOC119662463 [Teleopsis dalmanni]